ncbi:MAG: HlyD family efflux transporter periplasmic adaptor subunit [Bacteroidota bacterium]
MSLAERPEDIHLNEQEEVQQILGAPPGGLLRWGITLIFAGVALLLLLSWLIKYPDTIKAEVVLTTEKPPIRVVAPISGNLDSLLVKDGQLVKEGQDIAFFENPASREDVYQLEAFLEKIDVDDVSWRRIDFPRGLQLGPLQDAYSTLMQNQEEYRIFLKQDITSASKRSLSQQINHIESVNRSLAAQANTQRQKMKLAEENWQRNQLLAASNNVSKREVELAQSTYLEEKRSFESLETSILENEVRIERLKLQKLELNKGRAEGKANRRAVLREDYNRLRSALRTWKQQLLIRAPITGKISLAAIWTDGQYVISDQEILTIVPPDSENQPIVAKGRLPLFGSGKVSVDSSRVNIRLANYPYQEFGALEAKIRTIASVPAEGTYPIEFQLPDMITTYNKTIPFQQEMPGVANIITEDRSIAERIFEKILSIVENR